MVMVARTILMEVCRSWQGLVDFLSFMDKRVQAGASLALSQESKSKDRQAQSDWDTA